MRKQSYVSLGSLALLAVLFVALTMISGLLLKGFRFDLTENRLFTLSEGTTNILERLEEPVTLYFYFSQEASREIPALRSYARRVNEMLDEFVDRSDAMLTVKRVDPKPFSEEEDQAAAFGLQAAPINTAGDTLYFGIAGTNSVDDLQVMPFLQPSKEKFLEYDLAKIISSLGQPDKKVLGLLSTLRLGGGYDPAAGMVEPSGSTSKVARTATSQTSAPLISRTHARSAANGVWLSTTHMAQLMCTTPPLTRLTPDERLSR